MTFAVPAKFAFARGRGHARAHVPATIAALLLATTLGPAPSEPSAKPSAEPSPEPIGGYWTVAEQRERAGEPRDGDEELTLGGILFSLGALRIGAAALTIWMARDPGQCPSGNCGGLEIYGFVGVGEGALMLGTGVVYLGIGGVRRQRHQRWERGESISWLPRPWVWGRSGSGLPEGGGLQLTMRF